MLSDVPATDAAADGQRSPLPSRTSGLAAYRMQLIGEFRLQLDDADVVVRPVSRRVLGLLGLLGGPTARSVVSGTLWPETTDDRAAQNLRSALWRLPRSAAGRLVQTGGDKLWLDPSVEVDLARALPAAEGDLPEPGELRRLVVVHRSDLLSDWDDPWALLERERFRARRTDALEALVGRLLAVARFRDAALTAQLLVEREPLRESAQRLLMTAQAGEGNVAEALRTYERFREVLDTELGVSPSAQMGALVGRLGG